jgi:hypothetical protein
MKSLRLAIIMAISACAAAAQTSANLVDNGRKAKEIIQKTIAAMGGQAYLTYVDMKQEGRGFGFYQGASTGVGVPINRLYRYPDKERYEFFKDGEWVIIHNGDKGYETTFRGTRLEEPKATAEYNRRRQYQLDVVLREWASDPRTAFFYDGETIAETRQAHKVTLLNANNQLVTLYINAKNFLPIKKTYTWRDPEYKEMQEESELFDNWRVVQGIATPHIYTRMNNGEMTSQRFIKTVAYNVNAGEAPFTPPVVNYDRTKK